MSLKLQEEVNDLSKRLDAAFKLIKDIERKHKQDKRELLNKLGSINYQGGIE